jgi:hypothetical protein
MSKPFFARLRNYYEKVAAVLRGEADAASIFPNTTDVGISRERVYFEFLRQHAPSKCNVFFGGFIFDEEGAESAQLDIIITTDTAPRFDFHNKDGAGKSFSPVEGTIGVVSIKSTLDQKELFDALIGLSSIPPTRPLGNRIHQLMDIDNYDDWPLKIIYASKGIAAPTLMKHLEDFYRGHPEIPMGRRPNIIHVAGAYMILKANRNTVEVDSVTGSKTEISPNSFYCAVNQPDIQAICWTLDGLQQRVVASSHILFSYSHLLAAVSKA